MYARNLLLVRVFVSFFSWVCSIEQMKWKGKKNDWILNSWFFNNLLFHFHFLFYFLGLASAICSLSLRFHFVEFHFRCSSGGVFHLFYVRSKPIRFMIVNNIKKQQQQQHQLKHEFRPKLENIIQYLDMLAVQFKAWKTKRTKLFPLTNQHFMKIRLHIFKRENAKEMLFDLIWFYFVFIYIVTKLMIGIANKFRQNECQPFRIVSAKNKCLHNNSFVLKSILQRTMSCSLFSDIFFNIRNEHYNRQNQMCDKIRMVNLLWILSIFFFFSITWSLNNNRWVTNKIIHLHSLKKIKCLFLVQSTTLKLQCKMLRVILHHLKLYKY